MMEMFQAIAASVDSGPDAPIVVVLDCAPIHTSKEFRRVREDQVGLRRADSHSHSATARRDLQFPVESFLDQGWRQLTSRSFFLTPLSPTTRVRGRWTRGWWEWP